MTSPSCFELRLTLSTEGGKNLYKTIRQGQTVMLEPACQCFPCPDAKGAPPYPRPPGSAR
eukprot:6012005-Prymnesium_polylepis.1